MMRGTLRLWLFFLPVLHASTPQPADWVPARWQWSDAQSLELLADSPVNCLLLGKYSAEFVAASSARGIVTLAVLTPSSDVVAAARQALDAKVTGIVLEGDFPEGAAAAVRQAASGAPVIELTARHGIPLGSAAPVIGTYQGLWPGVSVAGDGKKKAGPSGTAWIDTNTGFIRAARAWGNAALWIANEPPKGTVITGERYLQVIADAAISGARWVLAFDADFARRLSVRESAAMRDWNRMSGLLRYFEQHSEWRRMREFGRLAIVQDPAKGGLLSGGILDMIAVRHTPVRPIPRQHLSAEALEGATMAVNVDADSLTPEQKETLRSFARNGGTLLNGPPGWKDEAPNGERITLDQKELERLNDIWHDVNSMVGRKNLGVRLFNVSSMLSNVLSSADGKTEVVHLVNYSDYPVENVAVHFVGDFKRATLTTPEGIEKNLEIYQVEEGWGVDLDKVGVLASIRLEQ
jgi:hypothetical protein